MSTIFGPFIQQGYIVPDIDEAMDHWLARGVGPFFIEEHIQPPGEFDGRSIQADLSAAFAYSGDQQVEVIQQHCDTPTIYADYLSKHRTGGLQHVAVWVDSIPEKLAALEEAGHRYRVRQRYGDIHAYLDCESSPGILIQLMAKIDFMTELFKLIRQGADEWDGVSAPVRKIDWSSGKPEILERTRSPRA
jgi:hypothetical protein